MRSNQTRLAGLKAALFSAALVTGLGATAVAQPAPAPTPLPAPAPAPAPAAPATAPVAADAAAPAAEPAPAIAPEPAATTDAARLPEPEPKPEPKKDAKPPLLASYDGGLAFATEDGKYAAKLGLRTQFRFETLRPTEEGAEFQSKFSVNRIRLALDGHVHGKDNRYKLEVALDDAGSYTFVKDAFVERKVSSVWLRVGQWKRPYSRQELTSDFASEFNERSIANEFGGGGRDVGFAVHNDYEKSPEGLEWVVGIFNGFAGGSDRPTQTAGSSGSVSRPTNLPADFGPTIVVRAGYNFGKIKGYSETDVEGGGLRYSVAASYKVSFANFTYGDQEEKVDNFSHAAQADAILKNEGLDVSAGLYLQKLPGRDTELGAVIQGGAFVTPKAAQLAARFAIIQAPGDREQIEARLAFNYFLSGHALKLATDLGYLQFTGENAMGVEDDADLQARLMAQLTF